MKATPKKKKTPAKKAKKLCKAFDPTFRLVWDDEGQEKSLVVGTMTWGSIGYEDAIELEQLIGDVIKKYFNGQIKKAKKHAK